MRFVFGEKDWLKGMTVATKEVAMKNNAEETVERLRR
jgi:hypothetical protein